MSGSAPWLVAAGTGDAAAAVAHLGCIAGGSAWYRFFGAGDRMVRQVEQGAARPHLITLAIATMLAIWSAYCFSAAGLLPALPLLMPALVVIAAVYLLRAFAFPFLLKVMPDRSLAFLAISSAIVLLLGILHAVGTWLLLAGR